jgi:hypothetical protein
MRRYFVDAQGPWREELEKCASGIRRVVTSPFGTAVAGVGKVYLELSDERWLEIGAGQQDLESRFEVFPIFVAPTERPAKRPLEAAINLQEPVTYALLETEDWLDPTVSTDGALGQHPIAQCSGSPGSAPPTATAACRYVGAVRFASADGTQLLVATLPFPFSVYCSAIEQGATLDEGQYAERAEA